MRNYEAFKGVDYRLEFDAERNIFTYVALRKKAIDEPQVAQPLLFVGKRRGAVVSASKKISQRRLNRFSHPNE
jgi:hypothetical protein